MNPDDDQATLRRARCPHCKRIAIFVPPRRPDGSIAPTAQLKCSVCGKQWRGRLK